MRFRKVRILYNRRSGPGVSRFLRIEDAFSRFWAGVADDIAWYFPASREESDRQIRHALDDGADLIVACGGDGTVSTIGSALAGTGVPLAVVPLGSGNGLARHFRQSLHPVRAIEELAQGTVVPLDMGRVNGHPFLVSASIAWDAELVRAYDRLPMRGIGSYILAGAATLPDYTPQPLEVSLDDSPPEAFDDIFLFTVGNVSGWGGGALIDPDADAADGRMEMLAGRRRDAPRMLADIAIVFRKGGKTLPRAIFRTFSRMTIQRQKAQSIQLDGELVPADATLEFSVETHALRILVPDKPTP